MRNNYAVSSRKESVLPYLLFLTFFLILFEVSFFIQSNKAYLFDFSFVSAQLAIPFSILPGLIYFLLAQFGVHLGFCLMTWWMASGVIYFFRFTSNQRIAVAIVIWLWSLSIVLVANQIYFPFSKFALLTQTLLMNEWLTTILFIMLLIGLIFSVLCAIFSTSIQLVYFLKSASSWTRNIVFVLSGITVFLSVMYQFNSSEVIHDAATVSKPNIIVIGVDSLRPDFLGYFGRDISTPFFDSWLDQATVFSEAVTPLARTFPSWTGILSGRYPKETGVRFNLAKQKNIDVSSFLPIILREKGYHTVFATDETRFSNIGSTYGFDRILSPPEGLNDFLIGTLNDFPLSNLIINTPIGRVLFPYSYGNRPVYFTYDPNSFLNQLKRLISFSREKPWFLAVHFCLPHHPYLYATSPPLQDVNALSRYEASIERVDRQLSDFMAMLKAKGMLTHAIVVLLSDHGEAFELPGDRITEQNAYLASHHRDVIPRFYPTSADHEEVNQSAGHGTDVLGLAQYHTLLAFKLYGLGTQKIGMVQGVVSLLAIKPTLLQLIDSKPSSADRGLSLAAKIKGQSILDSRMPKQHIFLESDFSPEAIRTVYPETRQVLLEGIHLFEIDPLTTRLTVKDQMGQMIIASKQYADIYGDWMLALYPQSQQQRMAILINLVSGEWTHDLQSAFAKQSPASQMMAALHAFYGDELI